MIDPIPTGDGNAGARTLWTATFALVVERDARATRDASLRLAERVGTTLNERDLEAIKADYIAWLGGLIGEAVSRGWSS